MKQTVEEAAKDAIHTYYKCNGEYPCGERDYCEHCNGHNTAFDCCECGADEFKEGFIAGAEWQSKQSPWINVKERLPENEDRVLVLCKMKRFNSYFTLVNNYIDGEWETKILAHYDTVAWMPIPSFDEILEANRDVLERIKEKGD
ncbi:DUF551 domain-containing protein [Phocaeicola massiliensis]|uniref:DUF551 domain-containing protein n=1 Tax=Phocaeicola massiliensis TaxID=204516 RepID=UPI0032EE300E